MKTILMTSAFVVVFLLYCCLRVSSMESRREERERLECTYWLYNLRNKHAVLPKEFVKIHIGKSVSFIVLEREATYEESERCDLQEIGIFMTAQGVCDEIERLDK